MPLPETRGPEGFWKRQFAPEMTGAQILFDVAAGILLPIACMILDPFVFRAPGPLVGSYVTAVRLLIGISMVNLAIWLVWRRPAPFMCGALTASGLFSFLLGLVLLPYSLYGVMIVIGIAGFSPFLTSFVFFRNGARAFALVRERKGPPVAGFVPAAAFALVFALPLAVHVTVQREVTHAIHAVLASDDRATSTALSRLRLLGWLVETDAIVSAYVREDNPERQGRLSKFYRTLTGHRIEERVERLSD